MATTPEYGFVMPSPTDLVTDLPADFEIFGDAVDAQIKALNPETTEGDLAYRGATADAKDRLAIGTAGQVLAVNAGEDAPEWVTPASGGGLVQLATGTLSGASVTLSSISASFKDLKLVIRNFLPSTSASLRMRFNGDTGTNYRDFDYTQSGFNFTFSETSFLTQNNNQATTGTNNFNIDILDYANAVTRKYVLMQSITILTDPTVGGRFGSFDSTAAISSITLFPTTGTFSSGDYILYGVQ